MEIIPPKVDYESAWDSYAQQWQKTNPKLADIGDEWIGKGAGGLFASRI